MCFGLWRRVCVSVGALVVVVVVVVAGSDSFCVSVSSREISVLCFSEMCGGLEQEEVSLLLLF